MDTMPPSREWFPSCRTNCESQKNKAGVLPLCFGKHLSDSMVPCNLSALLTGVVAAHPVARKFPS